MMVLIASLILLAVSVAGLMAFNSVDGDQRIPRPVRAAIAIIAFLMSIPLLIAVFSVAASMWGD